MQFNPKISDAATPFGSTPWHTLKSPIDFFLCCAGQLLAMKISQRTVALSGGMLFLLFAAHNLIYGSAT